MERYEGFERWLPGPEGLTFEQGSPISPAIAARWFHALYESRRVFSGVLDSGGRVLDGNRLSIEGCGFVREETIGRRFWECGWWNRDPELQAQIEGWFEEALATGKSLSAVSRYFVADGTRRMVDLGFDPIADPEAPDGSGRYVVATGTDITDMLAVQAQREDRIALEAGAMRQAEEHLRAALDAMIDDVVIARSIRDGAGTLVDFEVEFANRSSVDGAGRTPSDLVGARVTELYPSWRASGMFERFRRVVATGRPFVAEQMEYSDVLPDGSAIFGYWDIKVAKLGDGYIAASRDVTQSVLDKEAVRLAHLAAERERVAVEVLQQAALPMVLPRLRGVDIGVHYQPAAGESPIGGDWYDAFELGDGRLGFVIADVAGHGPEAAAFMIQLRNVLRTVAIECGRPDEILQRANEVALSISNAAIPLTTCCAAVLDRRTDQLTWALAGHPPPLLCRIGEEPSILEAPPGLPLGVVSGNRYISATCKTLPGDRIVMYTDGLVERRGESLDEGIGRLGLGVVESRAMAAQPAAEWLASTISSRRDDVAIVVFEIDGLAAPTA